MDRDNWRQKIQDLVSRRNLTVAGGVVFSLVALAGGIHWIATHSKTNRVAAQVKGLVDVSEFVEIYQQAWHSVQDKVDQLRLSEEKARRLELENAHLRVKLETSQFSCDKEKASEATLRFGWKLSQETGSRVGRTLASIRYAPPQSLQPFQLVTLAEASFKAREDEKAAVLLTYITGLEDNDTYKSEKYFLMTGIAWYRLDNFEIADAYLEKVLARPESAENVRFQAQARLWKALSAWRTDKRTKAQFWLRELIDHHPHSREAEWVNQVGIERTLASKGKAKEAEHEPAESHKGH